MTERAGVELTLFDRLGGDPGVLDLVTRFYDHMARDPAARIIREKHPKDLSHARKLLYEYFTGWFGGPPLYVSQYGHPRLRARHKHIEIGIADRDQWLDCLKAAMHDMVLDEDLTKDLLEKIAPMADHMRNQITEAPLADC